MCKWTFVQWNQCLNWTLNKPKSCINQTLNKILMQEIFVNLTFINRTLVYSEHKSWSQGNSFKAALATILTKKIICFENWWIALKWWNKGKYFSLSYHFLPFEKENYHRFIIVMQAFNLTSLSPYSTDLTRACAQSIL